MGKLKVLMMGGRRCGKTSALASMFYESINGAVKNYLTIADKTMLEIKNGEKQDSLNGKILELKQKLETGSTATFLVDAGPTRHFWDYTLGVKIPGTSDFMEIQFRDSGGEFFIQGNQEALETELFVKECDIFVIVVDTPYLMGPVDNNCTETINEYANVVNDIQGFLTGIDDNGGKDAKMVLFVPIKCEHWVKEGRINDVVERVKSVYNTTITNLSAHEKMEIGIIPIQTAGNIEFVELRDSYVVQTPRGKKRCCKLSETMIRLEDGKNMRIDPNNPPMEDAAAFFADVPVIRPYAWYKIFQDKNTRSLRNEFAPHNCDQLTLHILRFVLKKYRDVEAMSAKEKKESKIAAFFKRVWERFISIFGKVDRDKIEEILTKMVRDEVLRDSGDGIEYIKRCY